MYLFADLIIILVFLIGSAVLGFLLGRRSFRGKVDQLREQLLDRQHATTDMKTKLNRCTAKRVALERELTDVRTHLSGQGIDTASVRRETASVSEVPSSAPATAPVGRASTAASGEPDAVRASPGQRFRRQRSAETLQIPSPTAPANNHATKAPSKQDEVLQRVRARSNKINFERIGTAEARDRDDLKEVQGIGIFIEKKLNALGIYTFAQITRFNEEDQKIVNAAIEFFPGRVARDEWVAQARKLMNR